VSALLRRLFHRRATAEHNQVGQRDLLAAMLVAEVALNRLERLQHLGELRRLVDRPILLGHQTDTRAVGAATLV
jgi:hypothetical protein